MHCSALIAGVNKKAWKVAFTKPGQFLTADQSAFHAFLYSQGNFIDLGLAGSGETVASGINDWGQIVGSTSITDQQHAFIYENGNIVDLNGLIPQGTGWELGEALS